MPFASRPGFSKSGPPPVPLENTRGVFLDFEPLADAQSFDPKDFAGCRRGNEQFMPLLTRDFEVHKEILKLDRVCHADGLKTISRPPAAHGDVFADGIRIEEFCL